MHKIAIIILADTHTQEGLGRVVNAMIAAKEFAEAKDDVRLIFDGAGTQCVGELSETNHKYHALYQSIKDKISGACNYCAGAFKTTEKIKQSDVHLLAEYDGHPSFRKLINEGYQIIIF